MPPDPIQQRIAKNLAEAGKRVAPASRALSAVQETKNGLVTNRRRKQKPPKSKLKGMDWREFYWFCYEILGYHDMMPQPHDEMCEFIAGLFPDMSFKTMGQQFGLFMVPRNTFKTVISSIALPMYILWKNPNARVLISGHRHDAAKEHLRTIKWHVEHNEKFINLCGNWKPKFKEQKWAEDAIVIMGRDEALRDPSIDTAGVDRSKVGAHPDVIICDDLHSEGNVNSAVMRTKVFDHIVNMYPMLQPGGSMLVIGTRWHHADAYGKLLSLDAKALEDHKEPQYNTLIRSAFIEDPETGQYDKLYFPTRLDRDFLEKARYRNGPKKFALWYLNKPIDDSERLFPRDSLATTMFDYYLDNEITGLPFMRFDGQAVTVNVTLAWDPAGITPSDTSDFHGLTIVGCDPYGRWLVPLAEPIKARPDAVLERVAGIITMYQPNAVIIENVGQSGVWGHLLQRYMQQQGLHCPPIVFYKPPTHIDKYSRIETLQPMAKAHEIIIDRRCRELLDQLDNFPQLDFDDLLDSLQMHRDYVRPSNPESLDYMFDPDDLIAPTSRVEDRRVGMGAWAGRASSSWRSLEK